MSPTQTTYSTWTPEKQAGIVQRFMELYKSSPRGIGFGLKDFVFHNIEKNKNMFNKGGIGWRRGEVTTEDWRLHLAGEKMLGLGPILDDGTVWYGAVDVDKIGNGGNYDFDALEIVQRVYQAEYPIIPSWTKSDGLRLSVFCSEPVPAELIRRFLEAVSARLGCAKNEIFPKQKQLEGDDDSPSWIFMPYGPMWGQFPEQCGINEGGGSMDLDEYVDKCYSARIDKTRIIAIMGNGLDEGTSRGSGKTGTRRRNSTKWEMGESYRDTVKDTFAKGPRCLWTLVITDYVSNHQHNFLFMCAIFLMKKYPDNWEEALGWVNNAVLKPRGDDTRLKDLIKDFKRRGNQYNYRCKDEPVCSVCDAAVCRTQPFGVGQGDGGFDEEMAPTIVERNPRIIYFNAGDYRVHMMASDFLRAEKVKAVLVNAGAPWPIGMTQIKWEKIVQMNLENATVVEPSALLKTNVEILESLEAFCEFYIRSWLRSNGQEFLDGKVGDQLRIKKEEGKIYFKKKALWRFCSRNLSLKVNEMEKIRMFIEERGEVLREYQPGMGDHWYRFTISVPCSIFEDHVLEEWFSINQGPG